MRGRKYKRQESGKHGRRLLLAGLLVASGQFAKAETPVAMVPLPLTPLESGAAGVRSNPFCQPVVVEAKNVKSRYLPEPVQVAGLQPFGGIGEVEERNQHSTGAFFNTGVVQTSGGELQRRDQPGVASEGLRSYLQSPIIEAAGGVRANPLATQFKAAGSLEPHVDVQGVRALQGTKENSSGVSYSFSDEDSGDNPVINPSVAVPIEVSFSDDSPLSVDGEIGVESSGDSRAATSRPVTRPAKQWLGVMVERAPAGLPEPVNLRALAPGQFATGRILQVPPPEQADSALEEPVVELSPLDVMELPSDDGRLVNGGRPRVEVGRPPVAVDRMATMSIVPGMPRVLTVDTVEVAKVASVQASQEPGVKTVDAVVESSPIQPTNAGAAKSLQSVLVEPEQPKQEKPEAVEATDEAVLATFNLKPMEVRAIKIDSPVTQVQSDNLAVCAVIKVASGQIQLIATGSGATRLSVHTVGEDGAEKMDRYEVTVGEVRASTVDSAESIAMTLTQTVQSAFPGSNILVSAEAGRLIVSGSCPDEDSARRMLRMIRSACATPVVDRVKVR